MNRLFNGSDKWNYGHIKSKSYWLNIFILHYALRRNEVKKEKSLEEEIMS